MAYLNSVRSINFQKSVREQRAHWLGMVPVIMYLAEDERVIRFSNEDVYK